MPRSLDTSVDDKDSPKERRRHVFPNPDSYLKACFFFPDFFCKTPHNSPKGSTVFKALACCGLLSLAKQQKLIFFSVSPNSVSACLFGIYGEKLCLGHKNGHLPLVGFHPAAADTSGVGLDHIYTMFSFRGSWEQAAANSVFHFWGEHPGMGPLGLVLSVTSCWGGSGRG